MIRLCDLSSPVHIRQPESPHLKPYTFFVGRVRQPGGGERLSLHMGFFATLEEAETWVQRVRSRYADAIATLAPLEFLLAASAAMQPAPGEHASLTDTQVIAVLETRGVDPFRTEEAEPSAAIPLVKPEDTTTRRALKAAVAQGAPVSFALQLHWSTEPMDLRPLQSLPMFNGLLLYVMESSREDRTRYFLRLGFFADPAAARQVAAQVRAKFTAAVVVPVTEEELRRAREPRLEMSAAATATHKPVNPSSRRKGETAMAHKAAADAGRAGAGKESLDRTLELLAQNEMWADPESTSESGVRHLKVVVQRKSGRSRTVTDSSG